MAVIIPIIAADGTQSTVTLPAPVNRPTSPCTYCGQPATNRGRCARHARGTTTARGYGHDHKATRAHWEHLVATGRVRCARCRNPIRPEDPWDLGHNDNDRTQYNGPEHHTCNRSAAKHRQMSH